MKLVLFFQILSLGMNVLRHSLEAAAERFDKILDESSFGDSNVSKMFAKDGEGVECRPYRSRTCDTLIKRYKRFVPERGDK